MRPARISSSRPSHAACTRSSTSLEAAVGAVVGVGHVEIARRRARGIELAQQPHLRALAHRRARGARSSRTFARSIASSRSKSLEVLMHAPGARCPRASTPRSRAAAPRARRAGCPTCHAPVPAESSCDRRARGPRRATSERITPSAVGERQMLPRHTNSTRAARAAGALLRAAHSSPSSSTARNASCGTSTRPTCFIRFLPSFCFSSSFFLRVMSPP